MIEFLNKEPIVVDDFGSKSTNLFETIKVENGVAKNLEFHQQRVDFAFKNLFLSKSFKLEEVLKGLPVSGLFRAKLIYNKDGVVSLEFFSYKPKEIKSIALIEAPNFEYKFKYLNREFFDNLYKNYKADEFLILQNGYLKEFSIGNIALFSSIDKKWYTPKTPLLFGTTLQRYRDFLEFRDIYYKDLNKFSKIAILNAMVDFRSFRVKSR